MERGREIETFAESRSRGDGMVSDEICPVLLRSSRSGALFLCLKRTKDFGVFSLSDSAIDNVQIHLVPGLPPLHRILDKLAGVPV